MDRWIDGSMDRWIDGSMDRWIDGSMDRGSAHHPICAPFPGDDIEVSSDRGRLVKRSSEPPSLWVRGKNKLRKCPSEAARKRDGLSRLFQVEAGTRGPDQDVAPDLHFGRLSKRASSRRRRFFVCFRTWWRAFMICTWKGSFSKGSCAVTFSTWRMNRARGALDMTGVM
jgi:hypothetical protein